MSDEMLVLRILQERRSRLTAMSEMSDRLDMVINRFVQQASIIKDTKCQKCGSKLNYKGLCTRPMCPYSDRDQRRYRFTQSGWRIR